MLISNRCREVADFLLQVQLPPPTGLPLGFETRIVGWPVPGEDLFELLQPCAYTSPRSGRRIEISAGFRTDFASVPRLLRTIVDPSKLESSWAAVIHDKLYQDGPELGWTRAEADQEFADILAELGTSPSDVWLMHRGLRVGGWVAWQRYRQV